ncbi:MAG: 4'-phosphopantetheinyl transferase superfamily protein [Reichenbachiella sp.]|uniref:4'-phosphopantetheinyl transferase family protein n=1 Tax=Reichenbachiella sp. TaxID=2184521 RepID=UPI0029660902|nr:4'-phosphopantetheinyl transferase superfamily protein [Reichenbachiella sp.]MDW3209742.1 4'-phosphopantetheinyl transferase superfamily protein [Reichenbachiella sp.]
MRTHWIKTNPNSTTVGLAEITSEKDEILSHDHADLDHLHPKKRLEFLASRQLIKQMCTKLNIPYQGIEKDEFGKPHLIDSSYQISISHSYPMVACAIHPSQPCGIDIESSRPQLLKIRHKFLNPEELIYCGDDLKKLCLHWSTKEALYKIHGRKTLIFAEQLAILKITSEEIQAQIIIDETADNFILNYEYFLEYFLVYNV